MLLRFMFLFQTNVGTGLTSQCPGSVAVWPTCFHMYFHNGVLLVCGLHIHLQVEFECAEDLRETWVNSRCSKPGFLSVSACHAAALGGVQRPTVAGRQLVQRANKF